MLKTIVKNLFGSRNDRLLKEYGKKAHQINSLEELSPRPGVPVQFRIEN